MAAIDSNDKVVKYSFNPNDIDGGKDRLLPGLFDEGSGMKRTATPADQSMRAGFTRLCKGQKIAWYFWYKEIWQVIQGDKAVVNAVDKRTGEKMNYTIKPGDFLYFPQGVKVELTNNGDEDFYFLYVAVPASKRDAAWIAAMDEEDLNDIRLRKEF